jgi:hypothetical protein
MANPNPTSTVYLPFFLAPMLCQAAERLPNDRESSQEPQLHPLRAIGRHWLLS